MVPLFLRVNGVPEDKVHLVTTTSATTLQLMAQGKIDAATYESIYEIPIMKAQDIPFNGMNFADYGMNIMAYTIITNTKTVKDDPDLVKGFTKASLKGWEYAVDHPQEAIDALKKQFSSVDANNALQQFQLTIPLLHTDSTKDKPIGCADAKDVLNTESLLVKAGLIKNATEDPAKYLAEGYAPC
jgi:NitT/TauT family transport system substrate-binding protein